MINLYNRNNVKLWKKSKNDTIVTKKDDDVNAAWLSVSINYSTGHHDTSQQRHNSQAPGRAHFNLVEVGDICYMIASLWLAIYTAWFEFIVWWCHGD